MMNRFIVTMLFCYLVPISAIDAQELEITQCNILSHNQNPKILDHCGVYNLPEKKYSYNQKYCKHPLFALKTDLMLWSGVMPNFKIGTWTPNLALEFYFGYNWSAQFGWSYANWNTLGGTKELFAVSVGDLEFRYWTNKRVISEGFFVSVYGKGGQYDVQGGMRKTFQGNTGSFWSAGVGVGWLYSLSRNWALEAQLRGGYRLTSNELYDFDAAHYYYNSGNRKSTIEAQLKLNVVYRFDMCNNK